jgi:AraC-like DNA-binding protein
MPVGHLLAQMIRESAALDLSGNQGSTGSLVGSAIVDMLAATLEIQAGRPGHVSSHEARVERTKAYIDRHLDAASLDVEQLAAAQSVSSRTLTRAFAQQGSTPMSWLWKRRIEASYCALKGALGLQRRSRRRFLRLHLQSRIALVEQMLAENRTQLVAVARFERLQHLIVIVNRAVPFGARVSASAGTRRHLHFPVICIQNATWPITLDATGSWRTDNG